jgi:DNA repair photolyase
LDEEALPAGNTIYLEEHVKTLVNKVESPDVGMYYSMNQYQGCEHGCAYCYARNAHEYCGVTAQVLILNKR